MKEKYKQLLSLFLTFLKISAFTFGGGYAMIPLLQREFVEKKGWIEKDEFYNLLAIAESTPGPVAINSATYIGYKMGKVLGAFLASLAVCLPSFVIIFVISLFFDKFVQLTYVAYAFKGVQACVAFLILSAGIKMIRGLKMNVLSIVLLVLTMAGMITCALLAVNFSSIFYILIGGVVGLVVYGITAFKNRGTKQ